MKKLLLSLALLASPLLAIAGVSISIGEPNYYGQIQIGNTPPPLVYSRPVIIQPGPGVVYPPLYLRVPPNQYRNWRHHCRAYGACNRPVYFVNDNWYRNTYVPEYRHRHYHPPRNEVRIQPYPDRGWDRHRHHDYDRHKHHDRRHHGRDHHNRDRR